MAARRGKSQARRNSGSQGTPGWVWLVAGVAIAAVVFLAAPNLFKGEGDGFLRAGPQPNPNAQPAPVADADSDVGTQPAAQPAAPKPAEPEKPAATQYDFYTLLPGKEVEMSDAELAASARAEDQRRAKAEAQRAQAALEGKPVPPATTTAPAPAATASVSSTAQVTATSRPLP
ncbi:TPA: sporulation protein, partial [Stenotrophomonas maltophilia]